MSDSLNLPIMHQDVDGNVVCVLGWKDVEILNQRYASEWAVGSEGFMAMVAQKNNKKG